MAGETEELKETGLHNRNQRGPSEEQTGKGQALKDDSEK